MNCKQIITQYLKDNGFTGLIEDGGECRCEINDLVPCDDAMHHCVPAHAHYNSDGTVSKISHQTQADFDAECKQLKQDGMDKWDFTKTYYRSLGGNRVEIDVHFEGWCEPEKLDGHPDNRCPIEGEDDRHVKELRIIFKNQKTVIDNQMAVDQICDLFGVDLDQWLNDLKFPEGG